MKNINTSFDLSNNFLDYFVFFCKKIGISQNILDEIERLQKASLGTPKENLWEKWLGLFWKVVDVYKQEDHKKYGVHKIEDMQKVFFSVGTNFISGYVHYLQDSLSCLKKSPMNIYTSEKILDLEEEITEILSILEEENIHTDWKGLREYVDTLPPRIDAITLEIKMFQNRSKNTSKNIDQELKELKNQAWKNFLHSGNISLESLYNIQRNLQPDFSLSHTTKDIIESIQAHTTQIVPGIEALDLENKEILKALRAVQEKQADRANEFTLQLRNDLHTKFWEAVNDELFYNSLGDVISQKDDTDTISLHIVWYEKFDIISYEKLPHSHHYKMKVEFQSIDSDESKIAVLYGDPEKIIAWQQARVGITQMDGSVKIHLLNINRIQNAWIRIKKEMAYQKENISSKKPGIFSKTKQFFTKTYHNIFSKKVV